MLKLADISLILINPSLSNVKSRTMLIETVLTEESQYIGKNDIARAGARTLDVQVKSLTLYQLSYPG